MGPRSRDDADARLMRKTMIQVGTWITVAVAVLVIAVLIAAFAIVFSQIPVSDLFDPNRHEEPVDVGGLDVLVGGIVIGALAIVLAGTFALYATRRAVSPLVDVLARQRRFVADASHELRTPLAVLDSRLQVFDRSMGPSDPHRSVVSQLRADTGRLIAVVDDLLEAVDVSPAAPLEPFGIAILVHDAIESMRVLADGAGVQLVASLDDPDARVAVLAPRFHRALVALLDNAIKHSPAGTEVSLTTVTTARHVRICVADEGPGILGIDPTRVFDRFARSSAAVAGGGDSHAGFGIGLSLVQETVGRFGGSVEVSQTSSAGTTFTMTLPRARP